MGPAADRIARIGDVSRPTKPSTGPRRDRLQQTAIFPKI
ncbi:hypothetical protein FTUN_1455 [Frigoriglobus tundricola]|uniref:Uncharacterized protein n=1 Tax=Frigoriglobus tundricola TaxID=2774151 RepID=A0A6M5YKR4_9BACT|nr:hypothetical protein FTUN_1455 [Frigoriglobus tundricola]